MNCRHSENDLALYVEGDLARNKADELDVHLLSCHACRQVVDELRETQSLFKSIKQETVSSSALAHLRTRVMDQAAASRVKSSWGRWVYALAGVAFVAVVAVGVLARFTFREPVELQSPPFPGGVAAPSIDGPVPSQAQTGRLVTSTKKGALRGSLVTTPFASRTPLLGKEGTVARTEPQSPAEPPKAIMVKLQTDDPNIVIYWFVDSKGDSL